MEAKKALYHNPTGGDVEFEIGRSPWDPPVRYRCAANDVMEGPEAYAAAFHRIAGLVPISAEAAARLAEAKAQPPPKADKLVDADTSGRTGKPRG